MSVIGRHVRRLIVIALVCGLSVGTCYSPAALAEAIGGARTAEVFPQHCYELMTLAHRVGAVRTVQPVQCLRFVAESIETEFADHHSVATAQFIADGSIRSSPSQLLRGLRATQAISPRTLLALCVCWRV